MITAIYIFHIIMVCGAAFRIRGDSIVADITGNPHSTALGRAVWSMAAGLITAIFATHNPLIAALSVVALYLGTFPGWYGGIAFSGKDPDAFKHGAILFARGLWWVAPLAPVCWQFTGADNMLWLLLAAPACPIAYGLASMCDFNLRIGSVWVSSHDGNVNVVLGECFFGAALGVIIFKSFGG